MYKCQILYFVNFIIYLALGNISKIQLLDVIIRLAVLLTGTGQWYVWETVASQCTTDLVFYLRSWELVSGLDPKGGGANKKNYLPNISN